jgi:hypothetical protein
MLRFRLTDVLCSFALLTMVAGPVARAVAAESVPAPTTPPSSVLESPLSDEAEPLFPPPTVAVPPTADSSSSPTNSSPTSCRDQLWLISTRGIHGCKPCLHNPALQVQRMECGQGWQTATIEEFLAADDPQMVTALWIHGNDVASENAVEQGHEIFHTVAGNGCRGVRFVIWSWPSDYVPGGLKNDAQVKYHRTNIEPFYVGQVLDRIRPEIPAVLMGYSFGARISTGTLHLLGGGAINGRTLPLATTATERAPRRAVLLAAAVGRDALAPGHRHSQALGQVDRMVITVNPRDRVLRFFPALADDGDEALGFSGPSGLGRSGELRSRVVLFNVTPYVHKHHLSSEYQRSPEIMACLRDEVMTAGAGTTAPIAPPSQVTSTASAAAANAVVTEK